MQQEVHLERKKLKGSSGELMDKVKGLQMALIQKDGVISLLKIQIEQFEEREVRKGFGEGVGGVDKEGNGNWLMEWVG